MILEHVRTQPQISSSFLPSTASSRSRMADYENRLRKRVRSVLLVQSQAPFCLYAALWLLGAGVPQLAPPNAFDLSITCRRWRWLMRGYDLALKAFFAERATSLLRDDQPDENDHAFEQDSVFAENA